MRKLVAYQLLSLDGVAENPDEFIREFDEVMRDNLGRVIASQDAVLLGRRTYDEWSGFWPTSKIEPFAGFINAVQKFVVTSTLPEGDWAPATVINSDLGSFVSELKDQTGGEIGVHGSISLTQALLAAGLVDQLRLVVAPAIQVRGRKLFDEGQVTHLSLTRSAASPAGYLLLDYDVQR